MFDNKKTVNEEDLPIHVWETLVGEVSSFIEKSINNPDHEVRNSIVEFLFHIKYRVRMYLLTYGNHPKKLWEYITKSNGANDYLLDFVLTGCTECLLKINKYDDTLTQLTSHLAKAICINSDRGSVIPEELREQMPTEADTVNALRDNPWLIFVLAVMASPLVVEVVKDYVNDRVESTNQDSSRPG